MPVIDTATSTIVAPERRPLLEDICRRYGITRLAVFGSLARGDARAESDVDVLVESDGTVTFTLFTPVDLADDLSRVFDGRTVDVARPEDVYWYIRKRVLAEAKVVYAR